MSTLLTTLGYYQLQKALWNWPSDEAWFLKGVDPATDLPVYGTTSEDPTPITIGKYRFDYITSEKNHEDGDERHAIGMLADCQIEVCICHDTIDPDFATDVLLFNPANGEEAYRVLAVDIAPTDLLTHYVSPIISVPVITIDLETLATNPNSAIIEIGAVFGDLLHGTCYHGFWLPVYAEEQPHRSTTISTLMFHEEVLAENVLLRVLNNQRGLAVGYREALVRLAKWVRGIVKRYPNVQIITNGPEFDAATLATAYAELGGECPWKFRSNQSLRTLKWLVESFIGEAPELKEMSEQCNAMLHNGFFDAWKEFKYASMQYRMLREPWGAQIAMRQLSDTGTKVSEEE